MAAKEILFDIAARENIANGLNILANAVKVTLGPRGRNVIIEKSWGAPTITKDGVTVAKEIELEDRFENMGAQMVKEVASKTSDLAGDGTTTATVLAQAIFIEGMKLVAAAANPMDIKRGIDAAVTAVVDELKKLSVPTKGKSEIAQVGIISANGDETIGTLIAEAMVKVVITGIRRRSTLCWRADSSVRARAGSACGPRRCGAASPRPARAVACWPARAGTASGRGLRSWGERGTRTRRSGPAGRARLRARRSPAARRPESRP